MQLALTHVTHLMCNTGKLFFTLQKVMSIKDSLIYMEFYFESENEHLIESLGIQITNK